MTILPAKRTNSTSNENPEENNQNGQQMTLSLNIPQSRLNHNNPLLTQNHNQFSLHQVEFCSYLSINSFVSTKLIRFG